MYEETIAVRSTMTVQSFVTHRVFFICLAWEKVFMDLCFFLHSYLFKYLNMQSWIKKKSYNEFIFKTWFTFYY